MSIKRTYKVNEIYFLNTRGFMFTMEKNFPFFGNFTNREINLLTNEDSLTVKLKGIENLHKKDNPSLLLVSLKGDEKEIMNFLRIDNQKIYFQNVQNIYLEVIFFDDVEIEKILKYEQQGK